MNNKSVARRPDYTAFRVAEGGRFAAVIAAIRAGNQAGPPRAFWHRKVMITLIAGGRSLPDDFIERMPVLYAGVSDFSSASPLV